MGAKVTKKEDSSGYWVRVAREKAGLVPATLATLTGISEWKIQGIENGTAKMTWREAKKIAQECHVEIKEVFSKKEYCNIPIDKFEEVSKAEIGKRVRERRVKLGVTQKEVARRIGYSTMSCVLDCENGYICPTYERLTLLSFALNTSMEYLLYGEQGYKLIRACDVPLLNENGTMYEEPYAENQLLAAREKLKAEATDDYTTEKQKLEIAHEITEINRVLEMLQKKENQSEASAEYQNPQEKGWYVAYYAEFHRGRYHRSALPKLLYFDGTMWLCLNGAKTEEFKFPERIVVYAVPIPKFPEELKNKSISFEVIEPNET